MCVRTSAMSTPLGAASSRTFSVSRSSFSVRGTIMRPITSEAMGSAACQPVMRMIDAATSTVSEPSVSASTSRYAPRTLRLSFWPRISSERETALATRPTRANAMASPPLVSAGVMNRSIAS